MKNDSPRYKQWKKRQNQKNIEQRSRRKTKKKTVQTNKQANNLATKKSGTYNVGTRNYEFRAPLHFSLLSNSEETLDFFKKVTSFITDHKNFGKSLFFDISDISILTIDALMYLLAIVNNLNANFKNRYFFSGNVPTDEKVKKLFSESGFFHFVKYNGKEPLTKNNDTVQIMSGENCDTKLAKRLTDFVCEKAGVYRRKCSFLYNMAIELMSNTHKHAYSEKKGVWYSRWFCFAKYDRHNTISFIFMDTGFGIPSTVRKNLKERVDFFKVFNKEHEYVESALNGDFRTATKKGYRGKGLPKIREFCTNKRINNLHIITNKADVLVKEKNYESRDISTPLRGTLYYWQIDLDILKGETL